MNWWEELELETETEKRLQAEIERLRAVNARLLEALELADKLLTDNGIVDMEMPRIWDALAKGKAVTGQQALPGLE